MPDKKLPPKGNGKVRRQSRIEQINQMSSTSSHQLRSLEQGNFSQALESPPSHAADPQSAESPQMKALSRNASSTSMMQLAQSGQPTPRNRATTLDVPGLTRSKASPDGRISKRDVGAKLVIVMVGLPARGKSYITKKLCRFLNWQQHDCRIFNVGNTRRKYQPEVGPAHSPLPDEKGTSHNADFFNPDNIETTAQREKWAFETLNELLDYVLDGEGSVGILDATNTTVARRQMVLDRIKERSGGQLKVLFLESICTRSEIIESNVRLKLSGPDYRHMDRDKAIADFLGRLHNYEKAYQTISPQEEKDPRFQYIKMINVGQRIECGNIKGFLAGQAVFFLLNFNLDERQIWITRHGESTDNEQGIIGGDAPLTERGKKFSKALARFMEHQQKEFRKRQLAKFAEHVQILKKAGSEPNTPLNEPEDLSFCVWTSMLQRSIQTAEPFDENNFDVKEMRMLDELDAGVCDGMSYQEIRDKYPEEYAARMADKIRYRYPGRGGESYLDVINRLRPIIVELERMQDMCLLITHRVVSRILLAYFMNLGRDAIGDLEVPLHTLYVLEPKPYGVDWALYKYNERADWFYRVPKDMVTVQNQLRDQKRRFTVVATQSLELGDSRLDADDQVVHDTDSETETETEVADMRSIRKAVESLHN